ncbi:hypothetical protein [Tenacibaculum maritimum]|uniref:hypothetical protein n=1 Tax=Tenacibaculum maritimum TaxID=107401 RepID=UPI00387779A9
MKNIIQLILVLTLFSCSKKDEPKLTPLQQLPPATKVGANTAGCLVNGEAIYPKGNGNTFTLFYINQLDFVLGFHLEENNINKVISIGILNNDLQVGRKYKLSSHPKSGKFSIGSNPPPRKDYFETTDNIIGELVITYHDYNNTIISGEFWFDAIDSEGEIVKVREGRFDGKY